MNAPPTPNLTPLSQPSPSALRVAPLEDASFAVPELARGANGAELDKSGASVRTMFSDIARTYDALNHGLSLNLDRRWRRRAVTLLGPRRGQLILDACCGTGDLSLEIARRAPGARVVGCDFALPMLQLASQKACAQVNWAQPCVRWVAGDALRLPFGDGSFDAVTVAFGARNFEDTRAGLSELARVLKPGGKLLVLEFMRPNSLVVRRFFSGFNALLAPVGKAVSGHPHAYKYLPQSVEGFASRAQFAQLLRSCGLREVRAFDFSGGVSTAFVAIKPGASTWGSRQ